MKAISMDTKVFLYEFINKRKLGVIATVAPGGQPEVAVMEVAVTKDLELIIDTSNTTRKYANLKKNPRVAVAFGWEAQDTVQYEGVAQELTVKAREKYRRIFLTKHPDAKKWDADPTTMYFKITPAWIRYTAMDQEPWVVRFA